jgi:hypothetical protein
MVRLCGHLDLSFDHTVGPNVGITNLEEGMPYRQNVMQGNVIGQLNSINQKSIPSAHTHTHLSLSLSLSLSVSLFVCLAYLSDWNHDCNSYQIQLLRRNMAQHRINRCTCDPKHQSIIVLNVPTILRV